MSYVPQGAPLATAEIVKDYAFAGKSTLTIRNARSGNHFTYMITSPKKQDPKRPVFFVKVFTGRDNEEHYSFAGTLFGKFAYRHSNKARMSENAPSLTVFKAFLTFLESNRLPNDVEVWHEGCCGRCGRKLTVPESVLSGIGPECSKKRWKDAQNQLKLTLTK